MTARRRGLGRGLDALLGSEPSAESAPASAAEASSTMPLEMLKPNRHQPRTQFDERGLEDLATSIREQGIVQPIVVAPRDDGRYTIVAGERRWRAARRAGLKQVPVVVREVSGDQELLELALVENIQRADLNPVEEAEAYKSLAERFGLSQEQIGRRVGKSRPTVANALRLLRLPATVQDLLRDGTLTAGQVRPLAALADADQQWALAQRAVTEGLSARQLEAAVAEDRSPKPRAKSDRSTEPDVHTRAATERLTQALQTRVDIVRRRRGGQIRIDFHSEEELIRLYDHLTQAKGDA